MKKFTKELAAAYKYNVSLTELPEKPTRNKTVIYGLTPLLPLHLGFDPVIATLRHFLAEGYHVKIIFGDDYLRMEDKLDLKPAQYKNICAYYKYIFKASGLQDAQFILHSRATGKAAYWFLLANLANDMSLRNVYQSLPAEYRDVSIPLAKSMHTLMQTADINFFKAEYVIGSRSQERIYFVSRELLRKNHLPISGVVLVNEIHDLFGKDLKESNSKSRLSYHENAASLKMKLAQLRTDDRETIYSLFLNSVLPYESVKFRGKTLDPAGLQKLIFVKNKDNFQELMELLYNTVLARLTKLQSGFDEHPELLEWIDLNRVRALAQK